MRQRRDHWRPGLSDTPLITPTDVHYFLSCPHTYTRKLQGRWQLAVEPRPLDAAIMQYGLEHEARVVAEMGCREVQVDEFDYQAAFASSLALMRQGVECIYQGALLVPPLRGRPDLLRRVPGRSLLGDYHYEPGDVKSAARARGDHVVQVTVYALMLHEVQGVCPREGFLILRDGREERFTIDEYKLAVQDVVDEMAAIREGRTPPPDLHLYPGCGGCRWRQACGADAVARHDISLVPGVPRAYREALLAGGLESAHELAACDVSAAAESTGLPMEWLAPARLRASAWLLGKPVATGLAGIGESGAASIALMWETDLLAAERPVVLAAYQVRDTSAATSRSEVFLSLGPDDAEIQMSRFVRDVRTHSSHLPNAPLLVPSNSRLSDLAGTVRGIELDWAPHLLDVCAAARRAWAFPGPIEDARSMLDQLRHAAVAPGAALPFRTAGNDHPALLYRRFRDRADGRAQRQLVEHARDALADLFALYDLLRGR